MDLIEPQNPHKQDIPHIVNQFALAWLKTRINWAALQTNDVTESLLRDALYQGFNNGESMNQIATRVQDVFENCSKARAQMIARTEVIAASSQGQIEGYKAMGCTKVEFYTAHNEKTCEYCMEFHQQVTPIGEQMPIPLHPNCRCVYLPVLD